MEPKVFLRLDDTETATRPTDAAGALLPFEAPTAYAASAVVPGVPSIVDGVTGLARYFGGAGSPRGYATRDVVSGSTLFARDVTIQTIIRVDKALQTAGSANAGTIIARGLGNSAAEYHPFALEVRLVNAAAEIAELRFAWQDSAGVVLPQVGGHFQMSADFVMLTATRRWISSSEVLLRYYLADELLAEIVSTDGDIAGGTTGVTSLGTRYSGGAWGRFFGGAIDQLRILDRELAAEEIAMTWDRITRIQPNAVALVRDCWPPGMPISQSATSRVQRENMIIGNALGYAEAQGENIRRNIFPTRAYGIALEDWEETTGAPRKLADDIDTRRRRVVGRLRQDLGFSVDGVKKALEELAGTDVANLAVYGFSPTTVDTWASLNTKRWRYAPSASFAVASNLLRATNGANIRFDMPDWITGLQPIGGYGKQALIATKIAPTTIATQGAAGVMLFDMARKNAVLLGYRNNAGTYQLVREEYVAGVGQGATVIATLGAVIVPVWVILEHLGIDAGNGLNMFRARYSTTSDVAGFTAVDFSASAALCTRDKPLDWAGFFVRTFTATAANVVVDFGATTVRAPNGDRAFHSYVYRDPALAGSPDFVGGNLVFADLKHAWTIGGFVSTLDAKYDSADTTYDGPPMGGIDDAVVVVPPTWSVDATATRGVPVDATEWAAVISSAATASGLSFAGVSVSSVYLLQDASGGAVDAVGGKNLTASGTLAYQQAVTGWSRKSILTTRGVAGMLANATFTNINAQSKLVLVYARTAAAGLLVTRTITRFGDTFNADAPLETNTTPRLSLGAGGASRVAGVSNPADAVRPYVLRVNTTANLVDAFSDQEKIVGGARTAVGTTFTLGGDNSQTYFPGDTDYLYAAVFTGASAELTDAQIKALLQALGWSIPW